MPARGGKPSIHQIFQDALQRGCSRLSVASRQAIASYIRSQESATGGFPNKAGTPDVYYTFFGLMCALFLDVKVNVRRHRAFLSSFDRRRLDLPQFVACIQSVHLLRIFALPSLLRRLAPPLSYPIVHTQSVRKDLSALMCNETRLPLGDPHSPYSVFLSAMLINDPERLSVWFRNHAGAYRTPSGGWTNLRNATSPSLNATTSALMILHLLQAPADTPSIAWLKAQQHPLGGFPAAPDAPVADLLSTATALLALHTYGATPPYPAIDFIHAHWRTNGGFAGVFYDEATDCEYTFYGLLALAFAE